MSTYSRDSGKTLKKADPSTIHDKFLVGYQGWFTCPGDGPPISPGHHGWLHWFNDPIPAGGHPNTDLWPDVSEYSPSELFPAPGLEMEDPHRQPLLFSSRHPKTVRRHFNWMAQHGVDGAFLQRFLGQCDVERGNAGIRNLRDEVGDRVREAAEAEGRVFSIMYDITDVPPDRVQPVLEQDWMHLIRTKGVLDSPSYLREKGRPVITLWGFGFEGRPYTPAQVRAIVRFIRTHTPGGAYIMAGVPAHWRTSVSDADPDPEWVNVWIEEFDAISPWTIGRYHDEDSVDRFAEEKVKGDMAMINAKNQEWEMQGSPRRIDYIPVVHPGGSGYNLSRGNWAFNAAKRNGGRYLWRQIFNVKYHGARVIYGAMWDEYDEGTAFLPVVPYKHQLPKSDRWPFLALDAEGHDLPPDWYMRICGFAGEGLRSERMVHETFPSKELQDYWSSRPRYEEEATSGASGSASQSYQEWLTAQEGKENGDEPPPPPYSLEADDDAGSQQQVPIPPAQTRPPAAPAPAPAPAPRQDTRPSTTSAPGRPSLPPRMTDTTPDPAVSALTNEINRTSLSSSPPPIPNARPSSSTPVQSITLQSPPSVPQTSGSWQQAQWPPPNWQTQSHRPSPPPNRPRPHGTSGSTSPGQGYSLSIPPRPDPLAVRHHSGSTSPANSPSPGIPMAHGVHYNPSAQHPAPGGSYFSVPDPSNQHPFPSAYGNGSPSPRPQTMASPPVMPTSPRPNDPPFPRAEMCPSPQMQRPHQHTMPSPQPHQYPQSQPPFPQVQSPYSQGPALMPPPPIPRPDSRPGPGPSPAAPILQATPVAFALNAVESFASRDTRQRIESGVGSIAETGTKLFNKYVPGRHNR